MSVDPAAKLAFLRSQGGLDHAVECIETHMAWVFLSERRAWKLKKSVRLPYLDHSTVEAEQPRWRARADEYLRSIVVGAA
ncbi:MAG TPA: hypothetical protein VF516_09905 [Kofleriaceae bacterium]